MIKYGSLLLSLGVLSCLLLSAPAQASSPVQAAGKDHPATVAEKELPVQHGHLKASEAEMKKIAACAKEKGIADMAAESLTDEQQKTVDQCYRASGVVPPRDMKSYDTMKGQYY